MEAQRNGNISKYFGRLLEKNFKSDSKSDKIGIFTKKVTESDYLMKKVTNGKKKVKKVTWWEPRHLYLTLDTSHFYLFE